MKSHVPDRSRQINRRTFLSGARHLAIGGCAAVAILEPPTLAAAPTKTPMPSPEGAGSMEAYFIPVKPRAGRPAIAVMRGE